MLVLSRKRTEQIVIGSDIRITVVRVEGSHVRLGIEAPAHLMVLRSELTGDQGRYGRATTARDGQARSTRRGHGHGHGHGPR